MKLHSKTYFLLLFFSKISIILHIFIAPAYTQPASEEPAANANKFEIKKTFLSRQPEGTTVFLESVAVSPDRRHVAYIADNGKGMQVIIDNKQGPLFGHIAKGYPVFSQKLNRTGYIAYKDFTYFVVVDGKQYPGYKGVCCLNFSPDGKHFWYMTRKDKKQFFVLDGRELARHDMVDRKTGLILSPDSRHTAYVARDQQSNKVNLVYDGKKSLPYDKILEILFSPDSSKVAAIAVKDKKYYILQNNREIKGPFDKAETLIWRPDSSMFSCVAIKAGNFIVIKGTKEINAGGYNVKTIFIEETGYKSMHPRITPPVFSPNGNIFSYTKMVGQRYQAVIDSTIVTAFDQVSTVIFSPDSSQHAYVAVNRNPYVDKQIMVKNGQKGQQYEQIDKPIFSPDSKHMAYRASKDKNWFIVNDAKPHPQYNMVDQPVFSPDSKHMVYRALKDNKWRMTIDESEHTPHDAVSNPFFNDQGDRLAYYIMDDGSTMMVIDNKMGQSFEDVTKPCFSPDGQHVAYLAQKFQKTEEPPVSACMVDENIALEFSSYLPGLEKQIIFDASDRFHFLAAQVDEKLQIYETFLVEVKIKN